MELAEKYAYKVYEERSFSSAAKALYVSQPSLSSTVSRLESRLGFRIFDRTTVPLSLTSQGKIYIEYLRDALWRENDMLHRARGLSDITTGKLTVGGSCFSSYVLLPPIMKAYHRAYPSISVRADMGGFGGEDSLISGLHGGEVDLVLRYDFDPGEFEGTPLITERLAIAMRRDTARDERLAKYAITREELLGRSYGAEREFEDPSIFDGVGFILTEKAANSLTVKMSEILGNFRASPFSVYNSRHTAMHYSMMRQGLGAVMLADIHTAHDTLDDGDIVYFVPRSPHSYRTLYMVRRRSAERDPLASAFAEVAVETCKGLFGFGKSRKDT